MNKKELIIKVSEETGLGKREAAAAVEETFAAISSAMAAGDKVNIAGFGSFEKKKRAARTGRNPKTLETYEIPAKNVPVFKAGKLLRDTCAGKE